MSGLQAALSKGASTLQLLEALGRLKKMVLAPGPVAGTSSFLQPATPSVGCGNDIGSSTAFRRKAFSFPIADFPGNFSLL